MIGFAGLVEGPAEAMPGTLHVAPALGPCRLLRFEFNATQGHVIEASDAIFRVYTNDVLLTDGGGAPLEIASPYSFAEVQELKTFQSYDVLYCFHPTRQPREFYRDGPISFGFNPLEIEDGPFESLNKDESLTVAASAVTGTITLSASAALFVETDIGSLFQIEAGDFGDTPAWEPGITVSPGALRTSLERVYRATSSGRTGGLQPSHTEGVEWDGMGSGTDINDKPAPGVQWEYLHDKYGICRITAFTDAQTVTAVVTRRMPFSTVGSAPGTGNYTYTGGYYEPGMEAYTPPVGSVTYNYGTWRWRFGAFSDTRGWPQAGCIWNERLCLAKDSTVYASVTGDLNNFAVLNELGEQSNDMAFTAVAPDPNPILELFPSDKLMIFNAAGCFAIGPNNAASGVGPKNARLDKQHGAGVSNAPAVEMDGRSLTISRCVTRIHETEFDPSRGRATPIDITRYARHITKSGVVELAQQRYPHNHIWAVRGDGQMICASYLPEEQVLGLFPRHMASGVEARSVVSITDPAGKFEQVWIAAEFNGAWHVLRMAPWREDGESDVSAVMVDMALTDIAVPPRANFSAPLLAGRTLQVVADGAFFEVAAAAETGAFTLPRAASVVVAGLPYEAAIETLVLEAGGDNGPARGKMGQIGRGLIEVIDARGLAFGTPGNVVPLEQLETDSPTDTAFDTQSGMIFAERMGDHVRGARLRVERQAPFQSTIAAMGCTYEVQQR